MFRKPKRKVKQGLRRRDDDDHNEEKNDNTELDEDTAEQQEEQEEESNTSKRISEARKRLKSTTTTTTSAFAALDPKENKSTVVLHTFDTSAAGDSKISNSDLATRAALHLPTTSTGTCRSSGRGEDGIYRSNELNKFHAGPIKASQNIRVTARFDYQPDICKDYKDTGFCGFGDTCIYLHDRGDTLSGWQIEQQWEQEQRLKKQQQEKELQEFMDAAGTKSTTTATCTTTDTTDGLPFACYLCRQPFQDPVVTTCQHYFCEACIMNYMRQQHQQSSSSPCPICQKETNKVFHQPTKLVAKRKRVLRKVAAAASQQQQDENESWKLFYQALAPPSAVASAKNNPDSG